MHCLTEVERITMRNASDDKLMLMYRTIYKHTLSMRDLSEEEGFKIIKKLQADANKRFDEEDRTFPHTWSF
jgi:hypothetical protein